MPLDPADEPDTSTPDSATAKDVKKVGKSDSRMKKKQLKLSNSCFGATCVSTLSGGVQGRQRLTLGFPGGGIYPR